jgi:crossover junction endodeoxyribonuclease RuvC
MSIILGIDPGSRAMGYGIIATDSKNNTCRYIASGVIRVQQDSMSERLLEIDANLNEIIRTYAPDTGAIEEVFMHQNVSAALKLGQARGVAIVAMARAGLSIAEYSPREVKKAVVGYGAAEKAQVQVMIKNILKLNKAPPADAADALAIALCHFQVSLYQGRLQKSQGS